MRGAVAALACSPAFACLGRAGEMGASLNVMDPGQRAGRPYLTNGGNGACLGLAMAPSPTAFHDGQVQYDVLDSNRRDQIAPSRRLACGADRFKPWACRLRARHGRRTTDKRQPECLSCPAGAGEPDRGL